MLTHSSSMPRRWQPRLRDARVTTGLKQSRTVLRSPQPQSGCSWHSGDGKSRPCQADGQEDKAFLGLRVRRPARPVLQYRACVENH